MGNEKGKTPIQGSVKLGLRPQFIDAATEVNFKNLEEELKVNNLSFKDAVAKIFITENPIKFFQEILVPERIAILPKLTTDIIAMSDIMTQQALSSYAGVVKPSINVDKSVKSQ